MFGSLSWYGTKFIFLDQSASMVLSTLMFHSVHAGSFLLIWFFPSTWSYRMYWITFDLKLLSLLVHSLMVVLSLDGIHFIPCGTIGFHDYLLECGTNWCQGSLEALVLTAVMVHSVDLFRSLRLIQFHSLVLFVLLFHCRGLVLSWAMILWLCLELSLLVDRCKLFGTFTLQGSLQAYVSITEYDSIALKGTVSEIDSLTTIGTISAYDSLSDDGTISFHGSLVDRGAILPYGSLIMPGTIFSSDSLCRCGAFRLYGSL